jgi:hypothetical protein
MESRGPPNLVVERHALQDATREKTQFTQLLLFHLDRQPTLATVQPCFDRGISLYEPTRVTRTKQKVDPRPLVLHLIRVTTCDRSSDAIQADTANRLEILTAHPPVDSVAALTDDIIRVAAQTGVTDFLPFFLQHGLVINNALCHRSLFLPQSNRSASIEPLHIIRALMQCGATVSDQGPFREQFLDWFACCDWAPEHTIMPSIRALLFLLKLTPEKRCDKEELPSVFAAENVHVIELGLLVASVSGLMVSELSRVFPEVDLNGSVFPTNRGVTYGDAFFLAVLLGDQDIIAHRASNALCTRDLLAERNVCSGISTTRKKLGMDILYRELNRPLRTVFSALHQEKRNEIVQVLLVQTRLNNTCIEGLPLLPFELWELVADFIRWW